MISVASTQQRLQIPTEEISAGSSQRLYTYSFISPSDKNEIYQKKKSF